MPKAKLLILSSLKTIRNFLAVKANKIMKAERESIRVLQECAELQLKKGNDYQNPNSIIRQADYYPRGVATLLDIVHAKMLRLRSVVAAMENDATYVQNFESIEDSAKDMINYCSFIVSYCRNGMDGQIEGRDFLNRPKND
jgi:hypothetical protein